MSTSSLEEVDHLSEQYNKSPSSTNKVISYEVEDEEDIVKIPYGIESPSYEVLRAQDLLVTAFRKQCFADIFDEDDLDPKSSLSSNFMKKWRWGVYWTPGCGWIVYRMFNKEVIVPPGYVCCFTDEDDNYLFAKPGVHNIQDPFLKQRGAPVPLHGTVNQRNIIEHGDRTCVTVPQGMLGFATDMGQPMLLPPGLHSWKSDTARFERMYRLDDTPVLQVGPYTILTVDEGYVAVTINNGRQILLDGGQTHLLTHQKWRFERFINTKMQTEDLREMNLATADGIVMNIDASVIWRIEDANKAAIMVTETLVRSDYSTLGSGTDEDVGNLSRLRRDVLKQTLASIAKFVSSVHYADYLRYISSRIGESNDDNSSNNDTSSQLSHTTIENPMFDYHALEEALKSANKITKEFGVTVIGANIISAHPLDQALLNSLSTSAVASTRALQAEAEARGEARAAAIEAQSASAAIKIQAEADAKAIVLKARADAEAEILRSDGMKEADILRAEGAKQLAKLT